jgi:hypothetical protein
MPDHSDVEDCLDYVELLTEWEVDFLESLLRWHGDFTERQDEVLQRIMDKIEAGRGTWLRPGSR